MIMQIIPLTADDIADLREFVAKVEPPNDWEQHLPAMESLHETLEAQQRGEA